MEREIRFVTEKDCEKILEIYSYYIENTAITFETEIPSVHDFCLRVKGIAEKYPYLVYLDDGEVVGYAYASKYAERAAYCYDVEVSVYVMEKYHGSGVAAKLYECLFKILYEQGFYNLYAGITLPNDKSQRFHEKFGFTQAGLFHNTGYKFGKWLDVVRLEKALKKHDTPTPIILINELPADIISAILSPYK